MGDVTPEAEADSLSFSLRERDNEFLRGSSLGVFLFSSSKILPMTCPSRAFTFIFSPLEKKKMS
jgi:hypothetical protein